MKKIAILGLSVMILAGCATTPPPTDRLKPAPQAQITALPVVASATPASVRVVRDEGYIGSAVFIHVSLNGKKLASLNPGEYFDFTVDPGEYLFSVIPTDPFGGRHPTSVETVWRANEKYNYRVGADGNFGINLFRVAN